MAINNMAPKTYAVPKSVGRQLNFSAGVSSVVCTRLLEPFDLTLAQWAVLSSIWRNGKMGVKELAKLTGNAPPATSRIVDRMVSGGLLERVPDSHDRRAVIVDVSVKGEKLRHLQSIYQQVNDAMLSDLTDEEQDCLFDLLHRVEQNGRRWLNENK